MSQSRLLQSKRLKYDQSVSYWEFSGVDITVNLNRDSSVLKLTFSYGSQSANMDYSSSSSNALYVDGGAFDKTQVNDLMQILKTASWISTSLIYARDWSEFDVGIQNPGDRQSFPNF